MRVVSPSDWLLTTDRSGSGAIHEVECTSCHHGSGPAEDGDGPAVWALRHARSTGHTGFRRIVTDFQRALEGQA
ncbi:hypothetical protein AB0953_15140 [Streptomyces sp. NPDC046866]|uniref:DUF7848 domain-containing protein n=1 Tax=Streptomyces sp. NPDC046866 TaxID=3154921 RepID=UPI003453B89E